MNKYMPSLFDLVRFALLFFMVDVFYLFSTRELSGRVIADVQRVALQMKPLGAIVVYFAIAFAYLMFARRDGSTKDGSIQKAFLLGATIYAVFDFTNYAIFKKYPLWFALMDTLWGGILFAIISYIDKKWV